MSVGYTGNTSIFGTVCCKSPNKEALSIIVAGRVTTQALKMPLNRRQSTARLVRTNPVAQTDPTWQCVVLIGIPRLEAIRTVVAEPSSMAKPLQKQGSKINKLASHSYDVLDWAVILQTSTILLCCIYFTCI